MKTLQQSLLTMVGLFCLLTANAQNRATRQNDSRPQFSAFTAVETSRTVSLNWATSSEKNSSYFIVERSGNGLQFDSVGAVTALGRFDLPTSYGFTDLQPVAGSKYYRVRVVELDGTRHYGKVSKVALLKELSASR